MGEGDSALLTLRVTVGVSVGVLWVDRRVSEVIDATLLTLRAFSRDSVWG